MICAWCQRVLVAGTDTPLALREGVEVRISHGACRECADALYAEYEEQLVSEGATNGGNADD